MLLHSLLLPKVAGLAVVLQVLGRNMASLPLLVFGCQYLSC